MIPINHFIFQDASGSAQQCSVRSCMPLPTFKPKSIHYFCSLIFVRSMGLDSINLVI